MSDMENKKSDELQKQIEELKEKLKSVKKIERAEAKQEKQIEKEKEKEEKPKKEKKPPIDKKEYMRNYMKQYKQKNPTKEKNRRNTGYYMKKYNIPQEFKNEFGVHTCKVWKAIEAMKHIKTEHADIYPKLFKYI
jgi:sRNA-binding protein